MNQTILSALYEYNAYANTILLETAESLSDDEQTQKISPSHASVRNLLVHMFGVELFFLVNCQGRELTLQLADVATLPDLKRHWLELMQEQQTFIAGLSDDDLGREIHIESRDHRLPMWQLLVQAFVHSTQHRGELSTVLTQLGHPLPIKDPIIRFVEQSGQVWAEE
jgi:uncharacterized damage-inducible protein DinB